MVSYIATIGFLLLQHLGQSSADETAQLTTCLSSDECLEQSQVLSIIGITNFTVGNYEPLYGCFFEGDTAYFGLNGTVDDMSESTLSVFGERRRIWCNAPTPSLTPASTNLTDAAVSSFFNHTFYTEVL